MNRSALTGALVAVLVTLGGGAVALAQTPTTCSSALAATIAAERRGIETQAEVDRLRAAQTELDRVLGVAQKALADAGPAPSPVTPAYQLLVNAVTTATNDVGTGRARLEAAIAADAAADTAALNARALSDRLCTGPSGTVTVTPAPQPPIVVTVPKAINTGRA